MSRYEPSTSPWERPKKSRERREASGLSGSSEATVRPASPAKPGRRPKPLGFIVGFVIVFALLFFGGSWLASTDASIELEPDFAVATSDGRDVAYVTYERTGGRGMFELIFTSMFTARLVAIDTASGAKLWDAKVADELIWDGRVLAAGQKFVYLASVNGLYVLDANNGAVVAQPDAIEGLGASYLAEPGAYAFDPARNAVIARNADGEIFAIEVDALDAQPLDGAAAVEWRERLGDSQFTSPSSGASASSVTLSDGSIAGLASTGAGSLGSTLQRIAPDGAVAAVGDTVFYDAELIFDRSIAPVLEPIPLPEGDLGEVIAEAMAEAGVSLSGVGVSGPRAAVGGTDFVVVSHKNSPNDEQQLVSAVSLSTGEILGSVSTRGDVVGARNGEGSALVLVGDQFDDPTRLVVFTTDGVAEHRIGATNFFGFPL